MLTMTVLITGIEKCVVRVSYLFLRLEKSWNACSLNSLLVLKVFSHSFIHSRLMLFVFLKCKTRL